MSGHLVYEQGNVLYIKNLGIPRHLTIINWLLVAIFDDIIRRSRVVSIAFVIGYILRYLAGT